MLLINVCDSFTLCYNRKDESEEYNEKIDG